MPWVKMKDNSDKVMRKMKSGEHIENGVVRAWGCMQGRVGAGCKRLMGENRTYVIL